MLRKRSGRRILLIAIVVALAGFLGAYVAKRGGYLGSSAGTVDSSSSKSGGTPKRGKGGEGEKNGIDTVPVEVALARLRSISSYYYTTATLQPEKVVDIVAKVAGEVAWIAVEEGARVREGELLCKLNDDEQKIALGEARINRDKQKKEYERILSMYEQKVVSDKEFSEVKYQYELAENRFQAARLKYEYTRIRAPFDGVITKRFVDVGKNIAIGAKIFELSDIDPLLVQMYLPENEIAGIRIGQEILVTPHGDPGKTFGGKIVRVSPEVDDRTGTVKVTAETKGRAMPGSFARIKIVTDTHDSSITIPRKGLVSDAGEDYVYIVEADTVRKEPVELGFQDEGYTEILSGVELGDTVVVVGQGGLKNGSRVKVIAAVEKGSGIQVEPSSF